MKALRINRFLAQAGLGSRRRVEELVRAGRVRLNGEPVEELGTRVDPERDRVELDGELLSLPAHSRSWIYYKPRGVVCSFRRQGDAPCLRDVLPPELFSGRLFHVGRLDRESSGLLLLSDDGDLSQLLMHPSRPVWKRYRALLDRPLSDEEIELIRAGRIELDGRPCAPARIRTIDPDAVRSYRLELREGRNRQIRRMMELLGARVLELHRESIGGLELGALPPGGVRRLEEEELRALREQAEAGSD